MLSRNKRVSLAAGTVLAVAFILTQTVRAATSFTATNWLVGVPVPGIQSSNGFGQPDLKGNVCVYRVLSPELRLAGRLTLWKDQVGQTNGTALTAGSGYCELGSWDATGSTFTPSGGLWELRCSGITQPDGSNQLRMIGDGSDGAINGLRIELTATRGPGDGFDPAVPDVVSGNIEVPLTNSVEVIEDFGAGKPTGWNFLSSNGQGRFYVTNQQLHLQGYWPGIQPKSYFDAWAKAWKSKNWTVADGTTLEWRADLVGMNQYGSDVMLEVGYWPTLRAYALVKGRDYIGIGKQEGTRAIAMSFERVTVKHTNVVLVLALTRCQTNMFVTIRALDRDNNEALLYEHTVLETPGADPTLSSAEFAAVTGLNLRFDADVKMPVLVSGDSVHLKVQQFSDGTAPAAESIFDNVELRAYSVPQISIAPAVQLAWPITGMNFVVQGAPSPEGPWQTIRDLVPFGFQQLNLPQDSTSRYFRLRQTP